MKIVRDFDLNKDFFTKREMEELTSVKEIITEVKKNGDRAVIQYTADFDNVRLEKLNVEKSEVKGCYEKLDKNTITSLEASAENIRKFASKQLDQLIDFEIENQPGVFTGQKVIPIERIGVYAPGGRFPLPSTVLMCGLPAKVAGVKEIILCSPPTHHGTIHPAILVAADIVGMKEIYRIGGVQSIAAMAHGTETMRAVDKIVGPGNKYVTEAKRLVYGDVGIDFIAGPTEVMILADETANTALIAADLLAQAEHDTNAVPRLVTNSIKLAEEVNGELQHQLSELKTSEIAKKSLQKNGVIFVVESIDEAISIANRSAPEHLELQMRNPGHYINDLKNYGTLFIGEYSAEALGDYSSGLNHTLPTNGSARYTGGLSVLDFVKLQTTLRVTKLGLSTIGPHALRLAETEGLDGHGKSVAIRLEGAQ